MKPTVYFTVSESAWSPRDQTWGWRMSEVFESRMEADRYVKQARKDGYANPLKIEKVEVIKYDGSLEPPAWGLRPDIDAKLAAE